MGEYTSDTWFTLYIFDVSKTKQNKTKQNKTKCNLT